MSKDNWYFFEHVSLLVSRREDGMYVITDERGEEAAFAFAHNTGKANIILDLINWNWL